MKIKILLSVTLAALLTACGGGGGSDSPTTNTTGDSSNNNTGDSNTVTPTSFTVKVVDGYIKDATVSDALGAEATYNGNGDYVFESLPQYPITATGGRLIDTDTEFDIAMLSHQGAVISPITTLIGNGDSDVLAMLSNATGEGADINSYAVDYVESNNVDLTKIAQISYMLLKDGLVDNLKGEIATNMPSDFNGLMTATQNAINNSSTLNQNEKIIKSGYVGLIDSLVNDATNAENILANFKQNINKTNDDDDFDGDGVPNGLEREFGYDMSVPFDINGSGDLDGDGISNIKEMMYAHVTAWDMNYTNPLPENKRPNWVAEDTDDGLILSIKEDYAQQIGFKYLSIADDANSNTNKSFDEAKEYCQDLVYGGFDDWRLPTLNEARDMFRSEYSDAYINLHLQTSNLFEGYSTVFPDNVNKFKYTWTSEEVDSENANAIVLWRGELGEYRYMEGFPHMLSKDYGSSSICVREYK